ncbi:MAG: IclR family transcriptional regulator [Planctomycetota bacterium]|jgi:DNA-binding IclR family transcriptional regulator|nr:IclR family transcriptional regulator [Planctomycetota bacterium]
MMNTTNDYTISSVRRALGLLKLFEEHCELTLREVSELSGIGKSTALRLLYTLHREGFVAFDEDGKKYSLGLAVFRLGMKKFDNLDFRAIALPRLKRLADATGLVCYLGIERENVLVMLEKVFPKTVPLWAQLMAQPGGTIPLYSTGIGRLFLARRSDAEVGKYLDAIQLKKFTSDTVTDRKALLELVRRARREGVSCNQGENEPYISAICAPIRNHKEAMVAGISVCGMKEVIYGSGHGSLMATLLAVAGEISGELGFGASATTTQRETA